MIVEEDVIDLTFDGSEAPLGIMAFTVPGFRDRKVVLTMDAAGNTASLPLRFNDSDAEAEKVRDREFDQEVCHRLTEALESLEESGITVSLAKDGVPEPVLKASEVGIRLRGRHDSPRDNRLAREV